jgi:hypothetical protein
MLLKLRNALTKAKALEDLLQVNLRCLFLLALLFLLVIFLFCLTVLRQSFGYQEVLSNFICQLPLDRGEHLVLIEDVKYLVTSNMLFSNDVKNLFHFLGEVTSPRVSPYWEILSDHSPSLGSSLKSKQKLGFFLALDHAHDPLPIC